jgi:hypothetical protein
MKKIYGFEVSIQYIQNKTNKDFPNIIRGVKLNPKKTKLHYYFYIVIYLIKYSKKINILMLFHINPYSFIYILIYKILNPKGFSYIKADINKIG